MTGNCPALIPRAALLSFQGISGARAVLIVAPFIKGLGTAKQNEVAATLNVFP